MAITRRIPLARRLIFSYASFVIVSEIENLVDTIQECIAIRGIYLLMDERLDLICGPGTLQNLHSAEVMQKVAEFAAVHGWSVTWYQTGFVFWHK